MLYYALAAWTVVHTLVYFLYIDDICTYAIHKLCDAPFLKGLRARGYTGERLKVARSARLAAVKMSDPAAKRVYYIAKGAYIALGSVVAYLFYLFL